MDCDEIYGGVQGGKMNNWLILVAIWVFLDE